MKPSGRTYVVEVKRSRRLAKPVPKSIWHGVDLEGAAREVEDETRESREQFRPSVCVVELPEAVAVASPSTDNANLEREIVSESATSVQRPENEITTKARRGKAYPKPIGRGTARSGTEIGKEGPADAASLAVLDEENKRLRALWAVRLRRENHELRKMLSRFLN